MGNLKNEDIDRLVFDIRKPARYTGCEFNQIKKEKPFIRMGICYPDLYEIGMSNNGIRILYDIANAVNDVSCERVFAVPEDLEQKLRETGTPLYTLESYTPLNELDLLGFNVAYELLYTNILQVMELGHIPVFREQRNDSHPLIIAGGESVSNPLPLSGFIDAFFIGDGEEGLIEILNAVRTTKRESMKREDRLDLLSGIEGLYVPSHYKGRDIKKRFVKTSALRNPSSPILPNMKIAQERFVVEVTRGCKNLCNFCHAGYYELPYRAAEPETLRDQTLKLIENPYYSELTLSSLSISDYSGLIELLNMLLPALIEKGISISLPSLRVDKSTLPVIEQISDLRKTSLTFAVESGCDEIRNMANKKLITDDILSIAEYVFNHGWNLLKLYFMIGLPGCEEYDEAESIIELLKKIYRIGNKKRNLNVTISPFVPKPHTPFQWEKQMGTDYFLDTILRVKRGLPRQISIKAHDVNASLLEGILSRGDAALGEVIYNSYTEGARLDSWKEYFKFDIWKRNLEKLPDWTMYQSSRETEKPLPWNFISTGFDRIIVKQRERISRSAKNIMRPELKEINSAPISAAMEHFKRKYNVKSRIRLILSKTGKARFISHLDFIEIILRAFRMAGLPVAYTQGFNKRERISMGFPLPVGIESICEMCDVELYGDIDINFITGLLGTKFPQGISVSGAAVIESKESIMSVTCAALFRIETDTELAEHILKNLELKTDFMKETGKGIKTIIFEDAVVDYSAEDINGKKDILLKINVGNENSVRIDNMALSLSGTTYDDFYRFRITKLKQYRKDGNGLREI